MKKFLSGLCLLFLIFSMIGCEKVNDTLQEDQTNDPLQENKASYTLQEYQEAKVYVSGIYPSIYRLTEGFTPYERNAPA